MSELDLGALMRQAQQLQEQMAHMQKGLDGQTVEGTAGAGMVKVTATGTQRVTSITIDPSVLSEDREMLEDLIVAAVNNAMEKARELAQQQLGSLLPPGVTPGNLPGL
jgi:DNA-binding YbaB/EbfC family protein